MCLRLIKTKYALCHQVFSQEFVSSDKLESATICNEVQWHLLRYLSYQRAAHIWLWRKCWKRYMRKEEKRRIPMDPVYNRCHLFGILYTMCIVCVCLCVFMFVFVFVCLCICVSHTGERKGERRRRYMDLVYSRQVTVWWIVCTSWAKFVAPAIHVLRFKILKCSTLY